MRTAAPNLATAILAPRGRLRALMTALALVAMGLAGAGASVSTAASLASGGNEERGEDLGGKGEARPAAARRIALILPNDSSASCSSPAARRRSAAACAPRLRPLLLPTHLIGAGVNLRC
jgi:hypothetical protein